MDPRLRGDDVKTIEHSINDYFGLAVSHSSTLSGALSP